MQGVWSPRSANHTTPTSPLCAQKLAKLQFPTKPKLPACLQYTGLKYTRVVVHENCMHVRYQRICSVVSALQSLSAVNYMES